ncbi:glucose-1-phosphate cytidylyltransferase [Chamaesiphon minutus]|uniref:Nucleoside-diphosphate-sugar pyrophosphorylase family protein n=1 Tax=Chamaesiphon minutus (strain ATCC 27169 / PCC 6605) TaxID=1173020 RepID=K9UMK7_CHAP6|nr:glucose-1-phosphate cytidylyltransferase [Chamaesiphon minutus]AFY96322.1 Nucleoside-diphosphate-sugar pyrophosphorylase family protein [Chamaesiphon minutus PCC 6605]
MKVVLFCGGLGTRLREYSETIPKPMVEIGYRPIIWHLMRYYAHFGHKDFILCLGYRGDYIRNYFINYNECLSNDFVLSQGGRNIQLYNNDIEDWTITFVDTGLNTNIGQRLVAVKSYLQDDNVFLANYADGLSDLDLNLYLDRFYKQDKIASFLCVQPSQSFHVVSVDNDSLVQSIEPATDANLWINGGFFALKKEIFDYIKPGEELVIEPFQRLIDRKQLIGYRNPGFWACMDTLKEKITFDEMYAKGEMPWNVWNTSDKIHSHQILKGGVPGFRHEKLAMGVGEKDPQTESYT